MPISTNSGSRCTVGTPGTIDRTRPATTRTTGVSRWNRRDAAYTATTTTISPTSCRRAVMEISLGEPCSGPGGLACPAGRSSPGAAPAASGQEGVQRDQAERGEQADPETDGDLGPAHA